MKNSVQVSVIVLTYNPDMEKLKRTLRSIVCQKGLEYEVVFSDDGSKVDFVEELRGYLAKLNFNNYEILCNDKNVGTLKNYLRGLQAVSGDYVYTTSPGDLLYDENTLKDFYDFAVKNNQKICFGQAVFYNKENEKDIIFENMQSMPKRPDVYTKKNSVLMQKTSFLLGNSILGASYFRERVSALSYAQKALVLAKYLEDAATSSVALLNDDKICYFDRKIVWYEYGSGISTPNKQKGKSIFEQDVENYYKNLKKNYPKDAVVDAAYYDFFCDNKWRSRLYCIFHHPIVTLMIIKGKFYPVKKIFCTDEERRKLCQMVDEL